MSDFIVIAPLVLLATVIVTDAVDFYLKSPRIGLHWLFTLKYWLVAAPTAGLTLFAALGVYFIGTSFKSDGDVRKAFAGGSALVTALAGSQAARFIPLSPSITASTNPLRTLVTAAGERVRDLQRLKDQVLEDEAERAGKLRRDKEIRLARAIVLRRRCTIAQIENRIREHLVEYVDLSLQSPKVEDEFARIMKELNQLAGDKEALLRMLAARRLASLAPSKALDLASLHMWLIQSRIPLSDRLGVEDHPGS